jgi:transcriptional regulator GlxA family with amidase domain
MREPEHVAATVVRYVQLHAGEPIANADLAAAVGVNSEELHRVVRQVLGQTPQQVIRRVRVEGVRAELLRSDPDMTTIPTIAKRWGFVHLARFSAAYRAHCNESPERTHRTTAAG